MKYRHFLAFLLLSALAISCTGSAKDNQPQQFEKMRAVCNESDLAQTNQQLTVKYLGKAYNFCCPACAKLFKTNPGYYANKIKIINLEASQFKFSPNTIVVNKNDIVRLVTTSKDVTHGVYIKDYAINVPVSKKEKKIIEFVATKTGEFNIHCSVYCGTGHSQMHGKLIVKE